MPVESAADRAVFVNAMEFGTSVTMPDEVPALVFDAIFDNEGSVSGGEFGVGVQSSNPVLQCLSSDLPAGSLKGKRIQVDGVDYHIETRDPDGTGFDLLELSLVKNA